MPQGGSGWRIWNICMNEKGLRNNVISSTTNKQVKYVNALIKKSRTRREEDLFVAEGLRMCSEIPKERIRTLYISESFRKHPECAKLTQGVRHVEEVTDEVFRALSDTQTPQGILALVKQYHYSLDEVAVTAAQTGKPALLMVLERLQDPGNLGTIIRLADWFGIEHIFCSQGTVDVYNPKTIQATMGALARVKLYYCHLPSLIASLGNVPVYGTFLDGENMYGKDLTSHGLIVMGNEGNGIGEEVAKLVNERLYIPNYPPQRETSESLNVAVATAVICAEFRRRTVNAG